MKVVIKKKMSGTGSIHDLANEHRDRVISGRGEYAVVLAAYYGGRGYTTHLTEEAAIRQSKQLAKQGYSHRILNAEGENLEIINSYDSEWLCQCGGA